MGKILNNGGRLGKTVDYNTSSAYTTGSSNKKNSGVWNLDSAVKVVNADYSAFTGSSSAGEYGYDFSFSYPVTGVADGTTVDITASGTNITTSDFGSTGGWNSSLTQTVTITGGNIAFSISPRQDAFTEGTETVTFTLAATDSAGNQTGSPSITVSISDDSKTRYYGASTATGYTNPSSMNEGAFTYYYFYIGNPDWILNGGGPDNMYWSINASTSDFEVVSSACDYITTVNNYPNSGDSSDIYRVGLSTYADVNTEGTENFTLSFRESSTSGTVRATTTVTVNDTSKSVLYGVYSGSDATPDEGTTPYVDFYVTNSTPTMYWSIDSGTSDFDTGSGSVSWYTSVSNYPTVGNTAYIYRVNLSVTADETTEGAEDHFVRFRTGSTSGTIQATQTLTVQDTSTTPASGGGSELSPVLLTVSGQYSTNLYSSHSIDLSSYVGSTGRLVMWYETGTTYTGDLQIDNVSLNGTTYSFESNGESWQTTTGDMNTSSATTAHYESLSFADVVTGTSGQKWLRDSGGTGSSGTGLTSGSSGSFYLYAETSGSGWPWSMWLRSPEVTLTTGTCTFDLGRYGAAIGTARFYWYGTPAASGWYGVDATELQYVWKAPATSVSSGNSLHDNAPCAYTGTWLHTYSLGGSSYTNSAGQSKPYAQMVTDMNLRTSTPTSNNDAIISNGGFTHYIVMFPQHSGSGWSRPWGYWGIASGSTVTTPGTTDQYDGPLHFLNNSSSYFQVRRPSSTTSNGDYGYTATHLTSTTAPLVLVTVFRSDGTVKYWLRQTSQTPINASSISFTGSAGYGIKSGVDVATPVYADSYYFSKPSFTGMMEAGFFNTPLSDTDAATLADNLSTEYC